MNSPRLKRLLQNVALAAVSLLLCAALLEMVLRFCGYGNVEIYEPDPLLYWKLKPNQDCYTKIDRKPVHINSQGTRGREFEAAKPPNTIRILCLGDSRTFGWGLSEPETYAGVLEQLLQERVGAPTRVHVINAGVNAWSYAQMTAYFREVGMRYTPDYVVIGGANYWTQFSEKSSPEFVRKFMSRVRLKNFLRRFATYHFIIEVKLKEFYERHRTRFIPVDPHQDPLFKDQQQRDPEAVFRDAIEQLCLLAQNHRVKPILLYIPTLDDLSAGNPGLDLNTKIEVGRKLGVNIVDLTPDLAPGAKTLYLEGDPVHPNAKGNRIIARRLSEMIAD